jgi:hypothetical protein
MAVDLAYRLSGYCDLRVDTLRVSYGANEHTFVYINLPLEHNSRGHLIKVATRLFPRMAGVAQKSKEDLIFQIGILMRQTYEESGAANFFVQPPRPRRVVARPPVVPVAPVVPPVVPPVVAPVVPVVPVVAPVAPVVPVVEELFDPGVLDRLRPFIMEAIGTGGSGRSLRVIAMEGAILKEEKCAISWEPLTKENICVTNCGHFFTVESYCMWRAVSDRTCAVCRSHVRKCVRY